jgi:putative solute:sodium symporter small subunit
MLGDHEKSGVTDPSSPHVKADIALTDRSKKMDPNRGRAYWKENIRRVLLLLSIWFLVSYGLSILFVDLLDHIKIGGFKLGFWFAQQGSIYIFVILIAVYVRWMNRLDKDHDVDED